MQTHQVKLNPPTRCSQRISHAAGVYEIKAKPCMELRRSRVWNHHEVMYGINPKAEKREYALKRDAMPSRGNGLHATRGAR